VAGVTDPGDAKNFEGGGRAFFRRARTGAPSRERGKDSGGAGCFHQGQGTHCSGTNPWGRQGCFSKARGLTSRKYQRKTFPGDGFAGPTGVGVAGSRWDVSTEGLRKRKKRKGSRKTGCRAGQFARVPVEVSIVAFAVGPFLAGEKRLVEVKCPQGAKSPSGSGGCFDFKTRHVRGGPRGTPGGGPERGGNKTWLGDRFLLVGGDG